MLSGSFIGDTLVMFTPSALQWEITSATNVPYSRPVPDLAQYFRQSVRTTYQTSEAWRIKVAGGYTTMRMQIGRNRKNNIWRIQTDSPFTKLPLQLAPPRRQRRRRAVHERSDRRNTIRRRLQHEIHPARVRAPVVHAGGDVEGLDGAGRVFRYVDTWI